MAHIKNTFVNCFGTIACDTVILCIFKLLQKVTMCCFKWWIKYWKSKTLCKWMLCNAMEDKKHTFLYMYTCGYLWQWYAVFIIFTCVSHQSSQKLFYCNSHIFLIYPIFILFISSSWISSFFYIKCKSGTELCNKPR